MDIKAVIFDCFGVLVTDGWTQFCEQHFARDLRRRAEASDLEQSYNHGYIAYEQFVAAVAALSQLDTHQVHASLDGHRKNTRLLTFIQTDISTRYKVGMLSNIGDDAVIKLFSHQEMQPFSNIALSHKTGALKPQPEAYTGIAKDLGVPPQACLFIDDLLNNCAGAEAVGMKTIHYTSFDDFMQNFLAITQDTTLTS